MLEMLRGLVTEAREGNLTLEEFTKAARREFLVQVLRARRGNCMQSAKEVGVHRNTFRRMLVEHDIDHTAFTRKNVRSAGVTPAATVRTA